MNLTIDGVEIFCESVSFQHRPDGVIVLTIEGLQLKRGLHVINGYKYHVHDSTPFITTCIQA